MLYSIDRGEYIRDIPHENDFYLWKGRLFDEEYEAIVDELNRLISGDEIHTSSWIPGDDWSNTVYDSIYQKSCLQNPEISGMCFGLFLWVAIQNHDDVWGFGRYEKNGTPISGMTYFRLRNPPQK
jgi:hypothetical protein